MITWKLWSGNLRPIKHRTNLEILRKMLRTKYGIVSFSRFKVFRWAGGRPISGLSPVVVVFHSKSDLEKLWASIKGNLKGEVA